MKNKKWKLVKWILFVLALSAFLGWLAREEKVVEIRPFKAQAAELSSKPKSDQFGANKGSFERNMPIPALPALFAGVKNSEIISKLISCESEWKNVARMDSNGVMSFGILQFNGTATWNEFSKRAGIVGSPMNPRQAVLVADYMIENNLLIRWKNCAIKNNLLAKK